MMPLSNEHVACRRMIHLNACSLLQLVLVCVNDTILFMNKQTNHWTILVYRFWIYEQDNIFIYSYGFRFFEYNQSNEKKIKLLLILANQGVQIFSFFDKQGVQILF